MPHVGGSGKWHVSESGICQTWMQLKLEYIFCHFCFDCQAVRERLKVSLIFTCLET